MYARTLPLLLLFCSLAASLASPVPASGTQDRFIATFYKHAPGIDRSTTQPAAKPQDNNRYISNFAKHPRQDQLQQAPVVVERKITPPPTLITFAKRKPAERYLSTGYLHNKLTAQSIYVMDAITGETLFAKSPENKRQPASTIKVLTGILALQHLPGSAYVPVSKKAASMPRSKVYLNTNKNYRASDLVNAVLLASANDASVALAEKIAGSESAFARMMTNKAKELGAHNTVCRTASGLTARGQYSTARDLAVIFNQVMQNDEFAERMRHTKTRTSYGKTLRNHNKALWQITGAEGGKTGFTRAARQTYVGRFKRGEDEILVAIMGSRTMWQDIRHLVEYGFSRKQQLKMARQSTPDNKTSMLRTSSTTVASR